MVIFLWWRSLSAWMIEGGAMLFLRGSQKADFSGFRKLPDPHANTSMRQSLYMFIYSERMNELGPAWSCRCRLAILEDNGGPPGRGEWDQRGWVREPGADKGDGGQTGYIAEEEGDGYWDASCGWRKPKIDTKSLKVITRGWRVTDPYYRWRWPQRVNT